MTALDDLLQSYRDAAVTRAKRRAHPWSASLRIPDCRPRSRPRSIRRSGPWGVWAAVHRAEWQGRRRRPRRQAAQMKTATRPSSASFYGAQHRIQKADIDSFISASGKAPFVRRSRHRHHGGAVGRQCGGDDRRSEHPRRALSLTHLRESPIDWTIFGVPRRDPSCRRRRSLGHTRPRRSWLCAAVSPKTTVAS